MADDWEKKIRRNTQKRQDAFQERNDLIVAARADGEQVRAIAKWADLSEMQVARIVAAGKNVGVSS